MASNPLQMIQSMVQQNPQLSNMWQMAQQMGLNPNKEQVVQQLAQQKGMTVEQVKEEARKYGINI